MRRERAAHRLHVLGPTRPPFVAPQRCDCLMPHAEQRVRLRPEPLALHFALAPNARPLLLDVSLFRIESPAHLVFALV